MNGSTLNVRRSNDQTLIESGHFYSARGPSAWSITGWKILKSIKKKGDQTLLFIDDIHSLEDVNEQERDLPRVPFDPKPDFLLKESELFDDAFAALEILKTLTKRKKARRSKRTNKWYCSNIALTDSNGEPTCTLLDVGLSMRKLHMGFSVAVNILPDFYEDQQKGVFRLVQKIIRKLEIEFELVVILFSLNGEYRRIFI